MPDRYAVTVAVVWTILGVMVAGFVGMFALSRADTNALHSEIGRLDAKIDAQSSRIDRLSEHVEEHLRAHPVG